MKDIAIVGMGQLGSVFAHAFLRAGRRVVPVNRGDDPRAVDLVPKLDIELAMVAVGEAQLQHVVSTLPESWPIVLVQNGLLPDDWESWAVEPTVAVIWFEKKKSVALNVIQSSPIAGPHAQMLVDVLARIDVPAHVVGHDQLVEELVLKNVYIIAFNVLGLEHDVTVGELWNDHRDAVDAITADVLDVQEALLARSRLGREIDRERVLAGLEAAVEGDPSHGARGRSAPARLKRILGDADELGVEAHALRLLAARVS